MLRPKELSTYHTPSNEVSTHFFYESGFYEDCIFVLLQVTSPLRTGEQIKEAMNMYLQGDSENVLHFNDEGQERVNQYIIEAVQGL